MSLCFVAVLGLCYTTEALVLGTIIKQFGACFPKLVCEITAGVDVYEVMTDVLI